MGSNLWDYRAIMATPPDLALIVQVRDEVKRVEEWLVAIITHSNYRWVKWDGSLSAFRSGLRPLQADGMVSAYREGTTT